MCASCRKMFKLIFSFTLGGLIASAPLWGAPIKQVNWSRGEVKKFETLYGLLDHLENKNPQALEQCFDLLLDKKNKSSLALTEKYLQCMNELHVMLNKKEHANFLNKNYKDETSYKTWLQYVFLALIDAYCKETCDNTLLENKACLVNIYGYYLDFESDQVNMLDELRNVISKAFWNDAVIARSTKNEFLDPIVIQVLKLFEIEERNYLDNFNYYKEEKEKAANYLSKKYSLLNNWHFKFVDHSLLNTLDFYEGKEVSHPIGFPSLQKANENDKKMYNLPKNSEEYLLMEYFVSLEALKDGIALTDFCTKVSKNCTFFTYVNGKVTNVKPLNLERDNDQPIKAIMANAQEHAYYRAVPALLSGWGSGEKLQQKLLTYNFSTDDSEVRTLVDVETKDLFVYNELNAGVLGSSLVWNGCIRFNKLDLARLATENRDVDSKNYLCWLDDIKGVNQKLVTKVYFYSSDELTANAIKAFLKGNEGQPKQYVYLRKNDNVFNFVKTNAREHDFSKRKRAYAKKIENLLEQGKLFKTLNASVLENLFRKLNLDDDNIFDPNLIEKLNAALYSYKADLDNAKEEAERKAAEEKRLEELRKQEELKRQQEAAKKEAERLAAEKAEQERKAKLAEERAKADAARKAEADKAFRTWVDTTKAEMQAIRKESQAAREKLAAMKAERDAIRIELPKNEEVKSRLADIEKTHDALMKQHAANEAEAKRFEQLEAEHHKATAEYLKQAKAKYEAEVKAEQERKAKIEAEKKAKDLEDKSGTKKEIAKVKTITHQQVLEVFKNSPIKQKLLLNKSLKGKPSVLKFEDCQSDKLLKFAFDNAK